MLNNKCSTLALILLLQIFMVTTANAFILSAEGHGKDLNEAKASALASLSQLVISKVESSFSSDISVSGDDVNRNVQSIKKIASNLTFKGVQYVNESSDGTGINITAALDQAAVNSTLDFMRSKLDVDFSLFNREQKQEALTFSEQLTAFASILPASALTDFQSIQSWTQTKREELLKHLNQGRVVFVSNTPEYKVSLDNNPLFSGDFLEAGSYEFSASAEGYRSINGQLTVSSGETLKVNLPFIKAISGKQIALALPNEYGFLKDEIETILTDLGISLNENAKNSLVVKIKDSTNSVDEYVAHNINMRIEANKGNVLTRKATLKQTITAEKSAEHKVNEALSAMARKGVVGLMSKINLDEFFQ